MRSVIWRKCINPFRGRGSLSSSITAKDDDPWLRGKLIIMKNCTQCQTPFEITDEDRTFLDKVSPIIAGKKYSIPEPLLCPECRHQRRLSWRNERMLYWRDCDATQKRIFSVFSPESSFKVYGNDYWWSDNWSAMDYGRDFDFNRPFFDQFHELMLDVPQLSRSATGNINSDYVNQCGWCKNCYLIFEADGNENCMYCGYIYDSKSCVDSLMSYKSELCFDCVNVMNCYGLVGSQNCTNCSSSYFIKDCIGSKHCFASVNLVNKEYYFFNEKMTQEEYEQKISTIDLSNYQQYQGLKTKFIDFAKNFPHKYYSGVNNEDSTGDYLRNTQRCKYCFDVREAQDCSYVSYARNINNVHDMNVWGGHGEGVAFSYEVHEVGVGVRNCLFCSQAWEGVQNLIYCMLCINGSHDLFGCVGLKHAKYCIFNKQYSEDDYFQLQARIIDHMKKTDEWGEFFPVQLSPFGYNETTAQEYYPLLNEEAQKKGWKWSEYVAPPVEAEKTIPANRLPDSIKDIPDDVLNWAILCEESGKPFKIIPQELKFYRDHNLPLPRRHPDQRHIDRLSLKNPRQLWQRKCSKCEKEIMSSYSNDRDERVFCEECYLNEVY